jgi:hypothetical protein
VRRQRLSWLLFVPLTAIGGLVAHVAVQAVAVPAHHGAGMPHSHIDIGHWPLCAAVCGVVGLAGLALAGVRGRPARVPLWVFALVPPVGFAVQEEIFALSEGLATPSAGLGLALGLVLQIPFALAAFLVARALLTFAATIVRSFRARPGVLVRAPAFFLEPLAAMWPQPRAFVLGYGQRAPPPRS